MLNYSPTRSLQLPGKIERYPLVVSEMVAVTVGFYEQLMMTVLIVGFALLPPTSLAVAASPAETSDAIFAQEDHLKLPTDRTSFKTIKSREGDLIDCVPTHLQPAFDLPQLRGQKPQDDVIPVTPEGGDPADGSEGEEPHFESFLHPWLASGETCPDGTVPIRRTTEEDLEIDMYIRRLKRETVTSRGRHGAIPTNAVPGHEIYQRKYKDNKPRLFVYWTADGYNKTGCYNLDCPGFVQTNKNIVIGGAISPVSTYNGPQYDVTILVWKEPNTHNWWLQFQGQNVGYWPASLFKALSQSSADVEFGGEIYTIQSGPHTTTQMGSGHFPGEGFRKASFFRNLLSVNANNQYTSVPPLSAIVTNPKCYDFKEGNGGSWVHYFYYGGPGRNAGCP